MYAVVQGAAVLKCSPVNDRLTTCRRPVGRGAAIARYVAPGTAADGRRAPAKFMSMAGPVASIAAEIVHSQHRLTQTHRREQQSNPSTGPRDDAKHACRPRGPTNDCLVLGRDFEQRAAGSSSERLVHVLISVEVVNTIDGDAGAACCCDQPGESLRRRAARSSLVADPGASRALLLLAVSALNRSQARSRRLCASLPRVIRSR
jgi:hypothetical protein